MENYRIEGRLGSAPNIFRVVRVVDGARFAMKRVPLSHLEREGRQQAYFELGLASKLRHPSIVRCEDTFEFDGTDICLVLTSYARGDLAAHIAHRAHAREPFLEEGLVMRWFVQIALALHYLHSHDIVHRDVKASNIFIDGPADSDTPGNVVLGDFGIAQLVGRALESPRDAVVSGTPQYMAPELLQAGNTHTFRTDVWALGCVLYELLCFRHPFEAKDVSSLVVKVVQGNFQPIPQRYSRDVCELLVRLLDVNPATRPAIDEVLSTAFVAQHLRRHYASVIARGTLLHMSAAERRNFTNQMVALGVVPASQSGSLNFGSPASIAGNAPAESGRSKSLSPERLNAAHQSPYSHAGNTPNQVLAGRFDVTTDSSAAVARYGRRSNAPGGVELPRRRGVAGSHAVSTATQHRSLPELTATGSSTAMRSEHEVALYEATREHDAAFLKAKDAQRRGIHGRGTTSVKDTVDRVMYGPPAPRVMRRSPLRDGTESSAGFFS